MNTTWWTKLLLRFCHWLPNTLRPTHNGRHFADDTFKHIFLNENVRIPIEISLKFVSTGPINKIPAPMMVRLPTHICVTRPQWVNLSPLSKMSSISQTTFKMNFLKWKFRISIQISLKFVPKGPTDNKSALVQVMAWSRTGDKPLPEPMRNRFSDAYMRHYRRRWVD